MMPVAGEPVTPLMKIIGVPVGSGANAPLPFRPTARSTRMFDEKANPAVRVADRLQVLQPGKVQELRRRVGIGYCRGDPDQKQQAEHERGAQKTEHESILAKDSPEKG